MNSNDNNGNRVCLCEDGKYRWTYPLDMLKNPAILYVLFKIFGVLLSIPLLIALISTAVNNDWQNIWDGFIKIWLIVVIVFFAIIIISYLIDDTREEHDNDDEPYFDEPVQNDRARKVGLVTALVGIFAKRPSTAGAGMLAASRQTSISDFSKVKRIKPRRGQHLIKVNQTFERNQIYVTDEDFDFVLDFIRKHCPNSK